MDLKDIKAIIDLMRKNSLSEFELEEKDYKIKLKRGATGSITPIEEPSASSYAMPLPSAVAPGLSAPGPAAPGGAGGPGVVGDQIAHDRDLLSRSLAGIA